MTEVTLPFLRWAGGKRWIAPHLNPIIRRILKGRFIEPFLGSGAMFFAVAPEAALLGDLNDVLIDVYQQVSRHSVRIENALAALAVDRRTYYRIRESQPTAPIERAIRFIYLNRTCFGGLHRTNRSGHFNVPFGGGDRTPEPVYRDHLLRSAARILRRENIQLIAGDFQPLVQRAGPGDVVFCDPTYHSAGRDQFDRYGPVVFSWGDQERLAGAVTDAFARGAVCIVMNVDDPDVASLYGGATLVHVAKAKCIGNRPKSDGRHREIIAVLDPLKRSELWLNVAGVGTEGVANSSPSPVKRGLACAFGNPA